MITNITFPIPRVNINKHFSYVMIKASHRNMRKLANLYKDIAKTQTVPPRYKTLKYPLNYWKHRHLKWYEKFSNNKKKCYMYIWPNVFQNDRWFIIGHKVKKIKNIDKYIPVIKYSLLRLYKKWAFDDGYEEIPF